MAALDGLGRFAARPVQAGTDVLRFGEDLLYHRHVRRGAGPEPRQALVISLTSEKKARLRSVLMPQFVGTFW